MGVICAGSMYANWAPSFGGLEAVTKETEVRVEVGFIDHVVWRSRPGGLGGGGGADDKICACAMVRAVVDESPAKCRA